MKTSIYTINKGINTPLTFKGIKAQYILYLGGGLVLLLVVFVLLYIGGLHPLLCLVLTLVGGASLFAYTGRLSKKYGAQGLRKKLKAKKVPPVIRSRSREVFIEGLKRKKP